MRLIDADAIKLQKGFFEKVDNVPKFYEWLNSLPTASPWHRVEDELPKENGAYVVWWNYKGESYWFRGIFFDGRWLFFDGRWLFEDGTPTPDYWMPIEPPKEDA